LGPVEEATRRVLNDDDGTANDHALAGFGAYLARSQADEAERLFRKGLTEGDDPWLYYGLAELSRRSLDTRARAESALKVCQLAPQHPLCAVAARIVLGSVGDSRALDQTIATGALQALAAGAKGDAAYLLRLAAASARRNAGDDAGATALLADAGIFNRALLLGPWSVHHYLDWDRPFPPEQGTLTGEGPLGPIVARPSEMPDGNLGLWSEPTTADIYYWVADLEVASAGSYQLRTVSGAAVKVFVDGVAVVDRRDFEAYLPGELTVQLPLSAGRHRLAAKVARGEGRGELTLALSRADGAPSGVRFNLPQGPATIAAALATEPLDAAWPSPQALAQALEPEGGPLLAGFVAARDALGRDPAGAKALLAGLLKDQSSAPLWVAQAEATLADSSLPQRIAHGRARRDFEQALTLDPNEASALQRLTIFARGEDRYDEAAALLERARKAASPRSWRVLLTEMKLAQARGVDALASKAAHTALALEPGLCDAAVLLYDLARRNDSVAGADEALAQLDGCPAYLRQLAGHHKMRGELERSAAVWTRLRDQAPLDPGPHEKLAELALARGKPADAADLYARLSAAWPYAVGPRKRRADALERAGDLKGARAVREEVLRLDGSELQLRRAMAFEDGTEVLAPLRQDGLEHLGRYREASPTEHAASAYVLDASAVEVHPDGSFTERTHVLAKVVDQRGVSSLAEVNLPSGAELLQVRTLKKDGTVLEPESLAGKDAISLPRDEVGHFVEYENQPSTTSRGPSLPGFTAPKFYFQIAEGQLFRSVYEVRAPKGAGLTVDAHNMEGVTPTTEGDWERVLVERQQVPTYVHEPGGPSLDEVMPFVEVGTGAGNTEMIAGFSDYLLDRARARAEVEAFARQAAGTLSGRAAVEAVYAAVMREIKGAEAALTNRASFTLAQGRGSRLVLLRGALAALGIPTRMVLVRPFHADPAAYRFPSSRTYSHPLLLVKVDGQELLLDPSLRFAPFGEVAPSAQGQEAWVLPEPGEKPRVIQTPGNGEADGRAVSLRLALAPDGTLTGSGEEVFRGFDGAQLKASLERLNGDRRRQAIEAAIARTFENASLEDYTVDEPEAPGAPVTIRYRFRAPGYARSEGDRLVVPHGVYPLSLARQFLALFERRTPLLVSSERIDLTLELALPPGLKLATREPVQLESPFGRFERRFEVKPGLVTLHEQVLLSRSRVAPADYRAFGEFVTAVDRVQSSEWVLAPVGVPVASRGAP